MLALGKLAPFRQGASMSIRLLRKGITLCCRLQDMMRNAVGFYWLAFVPERFLLVKLRS